MVYGSVCSGIEAASVAWEPLGWKPMWFAEIDPFCNAVLGDRWPEVENLGDFTRIGEDAGPVDLLVAGTPCQSFSVAGRRAGLDDPRGVLAFEFLALAGRLRPRWLLFENVPGLLSSNNRRDFGAFLGAVGELGYECAYRVLDAQYFGVPQRRRRVFVVGYSGDWRPAAAVLLERQSLSRHPAPGREARKELAHDVAASLRGGSASCPRGWREDNEHGLVAPTLRGGQARGTSHGKPSGSDMMPMRASPLTSGAGAGGRPAGRRCEDDVNLVARIVDTAPGMRQRCDASDNLVLARSLRADGFDASEDGTGRGTPLVVNMQGNKSGAGVAEDISFSINAMHGHDVHAVFPGVRRLTVRECERLQGFPDDYTLVPYNGKPAKDGPRYRALGNSMAVPVMRWIGERIVAVEQIKEEQGS